MYSCTVQTLRLCTGRTAHKGSRGIAVLFLLASALDAVGGQRHAPAVLLPLTRPDTHCIGGWVDLTTGLGR